MSQLAQQKCVPCGSNASPTTGPQIQSLLPQIPGWQVIEREGILRLEKRYTFSNFKEAIAFTNQIGDIAEAQGHHPALLTEWGKVTVTWWTHDIGGLHQNDFILAAKTDQVHQNL